MFSAPIPAANIAYAPSDSAVFTFEADARTAFQVLRDGNGESSFSLLVATKVIVVYYAAVPRSMDLPARTFAQSGKVSDLNIRSNSQPKLNLIVYDEKIHNPVVFGIDGVSWNSRPSGSGKKIGLIALTSN
jgi:hypothetical protein